MSDPWAFGWTQLLTLIGFAITIVIAVGGFRTFGRWKREKIEEKRIDTAIDALSLVYEARFVFDTIRQPATYPYEYDGMPQWPGDDEHKRSRRGEYYAVLKRIEAQKEFFERAWKVQTRCTAVFGPELEETFLLMQRARRNIEVSAGMLMRDPWPTYETDDNKKTWASFRADCCAAYGSESPDGDKVGRKLDQFRDGIEKLCRPIVDREFGRKNQTAIEAA